MQNHPTEGQKKSEIRMESRLRGLEHLFLPLLFAIML